MAAQPTASPPSCDFASGIRNAVCSSHPRALAAAAPLRALTTGSPSGGAAAHRPSTRFLAMGSKRAASRHRPSLALLPLALLATVILVSQRKWDGGVARMQLEQPGGRPA